MPNRYSGVSTINHWITALLVTAMLTLGFASLGATSEVAQEYIISLHVSLGAFVFLFVIWRVIFRLYEGFPANKGKTLVERWAAYFVHRGLLILLVIQVVTGPLYLFTEGEGVNLFGWFTIYIPLESLSLIHEPMEEIHIILGVYIIPILLVMHILGGVRHFLAEREVETPADL